MSKFRAISKKILTYFHSRYFVAIVIFCYFYCESLDGFTKFRMDFIKNIISMFQENENKTNSDDKTLGPDGKTLGPEGKTLDPDGKILSPDNTIITNSEESFELQDLLTSQSSSISGPLIDEIASEMLQDIENNYENELNSVEKSVPLEDAKDIPLINLDNFFNDIQSLDDDYEFNNLPEIDSNNNAYNSDKTSDDKTIENNDLNEAKQNCDSTKDSNLENVSSILIINKKDDCYDLNDVDSVKNSLDAENNNNAEINRGTNLDTSTINLDNITNYMYVSKSIIVNDNFNSVIEKPKSYKDLTISKVTSHTKDINKSIIKTELKGELNKVVNTVEADTTYVKDILFNESNNNLTNNYKKDDILAKTNIESMENNIYSEKVDIEPKISIQNATETLSTNYMPSSPQISNNLLEIEVKSKDIYDVEFTKDLIDQNTTNTTENTDEIEEIIKIEPNQQVFDVTFETNGGISNNLSKENTPKKIEENNTDWEKLIDEIAIKNDIFENRDTQNRGNSDTNLKDTASVVSISSEENIQGEASTQNGGAIDTISLSSDTIHDSDYCSGYNSSDFEFITQSDAEADGLIFNVTNKKFKPNFGGKSGAYNAVPAYRDFFAAQNDAGPSNSKLKRNNKTKETGNLNFDPNKDYSYPNHVRYLPNLEIDNNLEHRIPEGEEYLNLFQGIYSPIMTIDMIFLMENKSMGSAKSMDAQCNGLGFDMRRMVMIDDADEECKREAEENYNKILEMYPGANRRRRRRQYFK